MSKVSGDASRGRAGEITAALRGLRFDDSVSAMLYGEGALFGVALAIAAVLVEKMLQQEENGTC